MLSLIPKSKATTFGNHLCPPNADAIQRALAPVMPDRVTAGWNNLLCALTTGIDPRTGEKYVDIGFMGLKGGSGAMRGTDGYDHIGMIDASGGVLDQDYEMFEQQTPHLLVKHEYLPDSAGAGQWRGGLGVETIFRIGSDDTQLVTFGDGDFEPAFGLFGGGEGTLNFIRLTYPNGRTVTPKNKDLITGDWFTQGNDTATTRLNRDRKTGEETYPAQKRCERFAYVKVTPPAR